MRLVTLGPSLDDVLPGAHKLLDLVRNVSLPKDVHPNGEVGKRLAVFCSSLREGAKSREPLQTDYMAPEALFQFAACPRTTLGIAFGDPSLVDYFKSDLVWCVSLASVSLIDPMSSAARLLRLAVEHGNFDPSNLGTTIMFDDAFVTLKIVRLPLEMSDLPSASSLFNELCGMVTPQSMNYYSDMRFPADLEWCELVIETLRNQLFPYLAI